MKRIVVIAVLMLVAVLLVAALSAYGGSDDAPAQQSAGNTYTTLDVNTAYEQLMSSENAIIVDVREPKEWAATGVPVGAALISLGNFSKGAPSELPQDKTIYVICNSGNRSRTASQVLVNNGYTNVINVSGGIQAWLRAGLPVERPGS